MDSEEQAYKSEIEVDLKSKTEPRASHHDRSTADMSRGRPKVNSKKSRDKSSTSAISNYQKSRLSMASRSAYGISAMSGAAPGYLGTGKRRDYVKADDFGVRGLVKRSNFPTESIK